MDDLENVNIQGPMAVNDIKRTHMNYTTQNEVKFPHNKAHCRAATVCCTANEVIECMHLIL